MAKKSAKSKGFRKQNVKKPYLSKRDILVLCVILALLAVGAFFLFRYDDGALKVQDGAVVAEGDNWLIVNGSNVRGRARYFKLGEVGEIEGYTREDDALTTDANIPNYVFSPALEDGNLTLTVTTSHSPAEALANATRLSLEALGNEVGELETVEMAGRTAYCYLVATGPETENAEETAEANATAEDAGEEADGEDAEVDQYGKSAVAYIDASHDSCVIIHADSRAESLDACLSDEALNALLEQAASAVTLEQAE